MTAVQVLDSSLRDGAQGEGISYSLQDKLSIVQALDDFGLDYIEAGNPASNPKDLAFFQQARGIALRRAKLCAFGSTCRRGADAATDAGLASLLAAQTPCVSIFGKAWDLHVEKVLGATLEENLALVFDTVRYLKQQDKEVIFDAEHFFDGYLANPAYALRVLEAARQAGADCLCLCDTNGGMLPHQVQEAVGRVCSQFPGALVGIHCHNDTGCAIASTLAAVQHGAMHVQGTFAGTGERCGNADLSILIPNLQIKLGLSCGSGDLGLLTPTARRIMEISNLPPQNNKPYTGASAFAHKGGMHIDGVAKLSASFEHIAPQTVGNSRRMLMSEVSGRSTVVQKLQAIAPQLTRDSREVSFLLDKLKQLENEGYQFEAADASFELMALKALGRYQAHFEPILYRTTGEYPLPNGEQSASAILSLRVGAAQETTAAMGNGPVHALDSALRKALLVFYPVLGSVRLTDYKVRVLAQGEATASKVRVLIESTDGQSQWTTVGVSTDVVAASWQALCDSIEYILHCQKENH